MRIFIFSFIVILLGTVHVQAQNSNFTVQIQNANSDLGKIMILVFNKEEGFPDDVNKAVKRYVLTPKNKQIQLVIEDLPQGKYAITVFHDEDGNGIMNTSLLGLPQEKYGFSNNPKIYFGPPSFEKASVQIGKEQKSIRINLR
jgi:uncharacterized protein (DUF2141 family)